MSNQTERIRTLFNSFKAEAETASKDYGDDIAQLTKDIAIKAGWCREPYTQKNGKVVVKTFYKNKPYDSVLCSKWFMYYKNNYIKKLLEHPELAEWYEFIVYDTFHRIFSALDINKITNNNSINQLFNLSLHMRVEQCIWEHGSNKKLNNALLKIYAKDNKLTKEEITDRLTEDNDSIILDKDHWKCGKECNYNNALNRSAASLEAMYEDVKFLPEDINDNYNPLLIELYSMVKVADKTDNFGKRLLDVMLYSNKKINNKNITELMEFTSDELASGHKLVDRLNNVYGIIKRKLLESLHTDRIDTSSYDKKNFVFDDSMFRSC